MSLFSINTDTLERIKRNDPALKVVNLNQRYLNNIRAQVNLGVVGSYIGLNSTIQYIIIGDHRNLGFNIPGMTVSELEAFYAGVSQSQSIQRILFSGCCMGGHILKLFDMPNLQTLYFKDCMMTRQTPDAIRRLHFLRSVALECDIEFGEADDSADFIALLNYNDKYKTFVYADSA